MIGAISSDLNTHAFSPSAAGAPGAFAERLAEAGGQKELREAVEQLVSNALIMPLLKQMRADPFQTDLFHGGQGEQVFGAQLDQHIADRMTKKAGLPIVDVIYNRFAERLGMGVDRDG